MTTYINNGYEYKPKAIRNFYQNLHFTNFIFLTNDKMAEIDETVRRNRYYFLSRTLSVAQIMTLAAEKLTTSRANFGLTRGDEVAYFYMRLVDPDFLFLEVYECANTKNEIVAMSKETFRLCDQHLIYIERMYKKRFHPQELEDIWARGRIKKTSE